MDRQQRKFTAGGLTPVSQCLNPNDFFCPKLGQLALSRIDKNMDDMKTLTGALLLSLLSWSAAAFADPAPSFVPEMITVPAGKFMMGSPLSETDREKDEGPVHLVTIARPFAVSKYEITFAQWDYCVADGGCNGYKPNDRGWGRGNRPVIYINWDDAHAYIDWLNKKTGKKFRLLTEAEWEYAARAGTTTTYYWGNEVGQNNANCGSCGSKYSAKQPAPVGSFKPNAFGLYDMLGNVWEWTEDAYQDSYIGAPVDGSAVQDKTAERHVLRGGSWRESEKTVRSARRGRANFLLQNPFNGFRIAQTLP